MIPLVAVLTTIMVWAPTAGADDGKNKYAPAGIGDLMPSPIVPHGQGTLFETYSPDVFRLDKQLSDSMWSGDVVDSTMHDIASFLMAILVACGRSAVTIVQWCFQVVSLPTVEPAISHAIGAAATPMAATFLPTAVALGGFIAWARRSDSSMLGQLAWVAASAAIATTFFTSPATWVQGVDTARQSGASIAMTTISGGLSGNSEAALPFATPTPTWTGDDKQDTIRKASDAVWRTYVATPWCIADLGSVNACKKFGPGLLKNGSDMKKRESYLSDEMDEATVGHDAVQWRQGHNPAGRIGVLLAAIVCAVIFCALVVMLAFTTLASLLGALMLLVCGVVFACLWCIPGRPRQWGVSWFEALIGMTVVSFTSTMLLGSVMVVDTALLGSLSALGWLMVSCLNIAAAAMAFKLKGRLDGIVSAGGAQLAGRGVLNSVARLTDYRRYKRANNASGDDRHGDMDRPGGYLPPRPGRGRGGGGSQPSGNPSGSSDHDIRIQRTRTYPPPPSYPQLPAGSYGDHAASRPGLPGGPGGPPRELPGGPGGPNAPVPRRPRGELPPGTTSKPDIAREKASTRPTSPNSRTAGGYTVRPGAPARTGPPDRPRANGPKVIQGTVVKTGAEGGTFRSYPPPPSQPRPTAPRPPQRGPVTKPATNRPALPRRKPGPS